MDTNKATYKSIGVNLAKATGIKTTGVTIGLTSLSIGLEETVRSINSQYYGDAIEGAIGTFFITLAGVWIYSKGEIYSNRAVAETKQIFKEYAKDATSKKYVESLQKEYSDSKIIRLPM